MKKILYLFLLISITTNLSAQNAFIELGRNINLGNQNLPFDLFVDYSKTSEVIYNNRIYMVGNIELENSSSFLSTNNTQMTTPNSRYFFLHVTDTLGNSIYSTVHKFSSDSANISLQNLSLKVDNGNAYILFNLEENFNTTNGTSQINTPQNLNALFNTVFVYFSESTILNNGNSYDYATFLDGTSGSLWKDFKIKNNNLYVLQETGSTSKFVTNGSQIHNSADGYLIKISSTCISNNLQFYQDANNYATYIGGSLTEFYPYNCFEIDDNENVYLALITESTDIITTNGTTVTNIGTDNHSILYKISAYSINNDLPINAGPTDFCTYIENNDEDNIAFMKFVNGTLYLFGHIIGNNLQTTGGINSTSGVHSAFLMSYSTASMNNNSANPDYFQLFQNVKSLPINLAYYDGFLYLAGTYFDANINTSDGSTLQGISDLFLSKISLSALAANLNWADNSEFLISIGGPDTEEQMSHLEVNNLGIHILLNECPDPVNLPTNNTNVGNNTNFYVNYCINGNLQYSTKFTTLFNGKCTATLNNSVYLHGFFWEGIKTLPSIPVQNLYGFVKITFFHPETIENDSIFPLTQTVCQFGLASVLDGENLGNITDTLPDLFYGGNTISQYSNLYSYQWQSALNASGPWSNIPSGILEDYLPTVTTQDLFYRRISYLKRCSDTLIAATSNVVSVLVNNNNAPQANAGDSQHTCPGTAVVLGGNPSATGGLAPYSFSWDNGLNPIENPSFTTNTNSVVTLTVTDALGCKDIDQVTVYVHQANAGNDASICNGQSVTIGSYVVQGLPNVTYDWSPTTGLSCSDCPFPTVNSTQNQTYTQTLTIPLSNGGVCQTTDQINITQVSGPTNPNFAGLDKTLCFGSSTQLGTPAQAGFTYSWYPASYLDASTMAQPMYDQGTINFPPVPNPATYTLVARKNGCEFSDNLTISQINANAGSDGCGPRIIGTGDLTPNLNDSYLWTLLSGPGAITGATDTPNTTISASTGGVSTYQLQVSLNGVTCTDEVEVANCGCTLFEITTNSPIHCPSYLLTNDSIQLTAGTANTNYSNLSYSWSPAVGLSSYTTQTVTLQTNTPTTYTVTITDPLDNTFYCTQEIEVNTPSWSIPVFNEVDTTLCVISPLAIGSISNPNYTYSWLDYTGVISTNSNPIITPVLGSNSYNLTVTNTISGCRYYATSDILVKEFEPFVGEDWYVCQNDLVQLSNTTLPNVSYSWSPTNAPWQNGTTNTYAQPIVLVSSAITFTATLTNTLNGCIATDDISVFVDQMPVFEALQNVSICRNGTIQIGNPPINGVVYSWFPTTGLSCTDCAQPFANPTNTTNYQVTMNLSGNCQNPVIQLIEVQVIGESSSLPDITFCPSDGAINLWATGPYPFNSYHWEPANLVSNQNSANPSSTVQTETTFYLTAIDSYGCNVKDTIQVFPTILAPDAGANKSICLGNGNVTLGSNLNVGNLVWSPASNLNNPTSPSPIFTPTQAGTYNFTLSQTVNSCTTSDVVQVIVTEFSAGLINSQLICSNSCTQIGLPTQAGASYSWSPSNGLNSTSISNPTACPTQSTDYTLVATGLNGCIDVQTVSITISPIAAPTVQIPSIEVCSGDLPSSINPNIQPVGNYAYSWTPSLGLSASNISNPTVSVYGLGSTNYNLTVTDQATGCIGSGVFTFNVSNCEEALCEVPFEIISTVDTICSGENTAISFTSDSTSVTYSWIATSTTVQGATNGTGNTLNQTLTNPSTNLGFVSYTVTPQLGTCIGESKVISIYVAPNPSSEIVGFYAVCNGDSVLLASLNSSFEYEWSNGATDSSAYFTILDNPIQLTLTSEFSCTSISLEVTLTESSSSTTNQTQTICEGSVYSINGNDYSIAGTYTDVLISASGCDSTVITELIVNPTYSVNNPQVICQGQNYQINGNSYTTTGIYTDIFQSILGCDSTVTTDLTVNLAPNPILSGGDEYCIGSSITIGTSNPFSTYDWSTGATSATINATSANNPITVTVTNAAGCSSTSTPLTVTEVTAFNFYSTIEICPGSSTLIHGNQETAAGIYSASFPSTFGCDSISNVTLVLLTPPTVFAGNDIIVCQGASVTLNATGANNYSWSGGIQNNVAFVPTSSGVYIVTTTNSAGCSASDEVLVTIESSGIISFSASTVEGCSPLLVTFTNTSQNSGNNCQWILGNATTSTDCNSAIAIYTNPGCYDVTLSSTSQAGCVGTLTLNDFICVHPNPIAAFTPIPAILPTSNPTTTVSNSSQNATNYNWNFGDGNAMSQETNPSHTYSPNGAEQYEIMLIASNEFGCVDTTYQIIQIEEDLIYYVPNTFTPDGDQFNNEFKPIFTTGFDPFDYNLKIYNRWGELIFESNNTLVGWNGTFGNIANLVQNGTYVWKLEFKLSMNEERKIAVGHVLLIR